MENFNILLPNQGPKAFLGKFLPAQESNYLPGNKRGAAKEWNKLVLVRNVGLDSMGVLNSTSIELAASLDIPHHEGAGGEADFSSKREFEKHINKNKRWASKRKKNNKRKL